MILGRGIGRFFDKLSEVIELVEKVIVDPRWMSVEHLLPPRRNLEASPTRAFNQACLGEIKSRPMNSVFEDTLLSRWEAFCEVFRRQFKLFRDLLRTSLIRTSPSPLEDSDRTGSIRD